MSCACPAPLEATDPRRAGSCNKCGRTFEADWLSTDETVKEFFDWLESSIPATEMEEFTAFRRHCEEREKAGRETFGIAHLHRSNPTEATEEAADIGVYAHLAVLEERRNEGDAQEMSLALEGARYAYLAHKCFRELAAKRRGSP